VRRKSLVFYKYGLDDLFILSDTACTELSWELPCVHIVRLYGRIADAGFVCVLELFRSTERCERVGQCALSNARSSEQIRRDFRVQIFIFDEQRRYVGVKSC